MRLTKILSVLLVAVLIIGISGCKGTNSDIGEEPTPPPETPTPAPPTPSPTPPPPSPEPAACPCEDGCCDDNGQCQSDEHCMTVPLSTSTQGDAGIECTYEVAGIACMDCCNLNAVRVKGEDPAPIRDNSTLERSDSSRDIAARIIGTVSGSWESAWDTTFGCQGNPIGCGNGSYTAVLTFENSCPDTIELCFRLP